jgi:hypothetical protein
VTPVSIDELRRFAEAERAGRRHSPLAEVGLRADDPEIECLRGETPLDSVLIAHTGGDSVHFCALETEDVSSAEWPAVMVVPA